VGELEEGVRGRGIRSRRAGQVNEKKEGGTWDEKKEGG